MGQQQGLLVMYSLAAVAIVFAMAAAFGAFNDSPKATGQTAGANSNPENGGPGAAPSAVPKDSTKTTRILDASVQHYADLLASGQKIVGHTHYPNMAAYGEAFTDPKSPAAQFAKFRESPNPESDTTYLDAEQQAAAAYGGDHGGTLDKWQNDMAKVRSDLGDWVATAAEYQQGAATQATLNGAATVVGRDLAQARGDGDSLGK